jgi:EAL domain-containing protein (putative c-di-GMP-specific phosphodiesterase class I)
VNLLHDIRKILKHDTVNTHNIIIEILETGTYRDEQQVIHTIEALKSLGFKIAIDDFGAGNSNFAHLMLMQVDYIKIDGQFIKNIVDDLQSQNITQTINQFAHLAGAKSVAEFVCDQGVFDKVVEIGVDYVQGYYICEPREASQIEEMLSLRER